MNNDPNSNQSNFNFSHRNPFLKKDPDPAQNDYDSSSTAPSYANNTANPTNNNLNDQNQGFSPQNFTASSNSPTINPVDTNSTTTNQINSNSSDNYQNLNNQPNNTQTTIQPQEQSPTAANNTTSSGLISKSKNFDDEPVIERKRARKPNIIARFFRFILILLIIAILLLSGLFIFILTNPKHVVSKSVVENSFLKNYVDLPQNNEDQSGENVSQSSSSSESKLINEIIGNQNDSSEESDFQFEDPQGSKSVTEVVDDVLPSVLSISLKQKGERVGLSQDLTAGTGYIASTDGLVVTNKHVVSLVCKQGINNIQITALSHDQKAYDLDLLSIDPVDDIAILKIKKAEETLKPVKFADSDNLKLGQDVIAVGNVLGELQNTVTKGILSGLNRSFSTQLMDECTNTAFQADNLIQTDAAINRGNSGGPLFNSSGQLIAMNTLGTADAQSIGLAIPSRTIQSVLESFQDNKKIVRARLGVASQPINAVTKAQNDWIPTEYGEIIYTSEGNPVSQGSAADKAGLKSGDIILEVNGEKLVATNNNPSPLRRAVLREQANQEITLTILKSTPSNDSFKYADDKQQVKVKLGSVDFDISKLSTNSA